MTKIKSVAVYCSSSNDVPNVFQKSAEDLGILLANHGLELVYGGGSMGLMGVVSRACLKAGGKVYGVIPRFLDTHEVGNKEITELVYVDSMHERKQKMYERADAFVILPGGFGTLDEVFEVMTWKQVGLHRKFIFIVNIKGYWSSIFSDAIDTMVANKFIRESDKNLFTLIERIEDIVPFFSAECLLHTNQSNYVSKWG